MRDEDYYQGLITACAVANGIRCLPVRQDVLDEDYWFMHEQAWAEQEGLA